MVFGWCAGSTQQHWPFPDSHVDLGYAYLFTHPGNPTIFWDHYFDNGYRVRCFPAFTRAHDRL